MRFLALLFAIGLQVLTLYYLVEHGYQLSDPAIWAIILLPLAGFWVFVFVVEIVRFALATWEDRGRPEWVPPVKEPVTRITLSQGVTLSQRVTPSQRVTGGPTELPAGLHGDFTDHTERRGCHEGGKTYLQQPDGSYAEDDSA